MFMKFKINLYGLLITWIYIYIVEN